MSCINTKFGYHFITVQSTVKFLSSFNNSEILESSVWFLMETKMEPLTSNFFRTTYILQTVLSYVSSVPYQHSYFDWLFVLFFVFVF